MSLARALSAFVASVRLGRLSAETLDDARTLLIDALACTLAGAAARPAAIAQAILDAEPPGGGGTATLLPSGRRCGAGQAALANGVQLRALDLMDVYVAADVCHPSEAIPAALACAEAGGASGAAFLEALVAALALHKRLTEVLPLHRQGLHHAGQAAWVVPLLAGRLLGAGEAAGAGALEAMAAQLLLPEGYSRGHVTLYKAFAYPLLARRGIEAVTLARLGLAGGEGCCEELVDLLVRRFEMTLHPDDLLPPEPPDGLSAISLKGYPAQYALQPLIAAAASYHRRAEAGAALPSRVLVRASRRTVERTADPAKYRPTSAETADHSLPFCLAMGLLEGGFEVEHLSARRWEDPAVAALMQRIEAEAVDDGGGYGVGRQELRLEFAAAEPLVLPCRYPPDGTVWRQIAEDKLARHAPAGVEVEALLAAVEALPEAADLSGLLAAATAAA